MNVGYCIQPMTSQKCEPNCKYGLPSGSVLKNLPAMQEMQVPSLGWEDSVYTGLVFVSIQPVFVFGWGIQPIYI